MAGLHTLRLRSNPGWHLNSLVGRIIHRLLLDVISTSSQKQTGVQPPAVSPAEAIQTMTKHILEDLNKIASKKEYVDYPSDSEEEIEVDERPWKLLEEHKISFQNSSELEGNEKELFDVLVSKVIVEMGSSKQSFLAPENYRKLFNIYGNPLNKNKILNVVIKAMAYNEVSALDL